MDYHLGFKSDYIAAIEFGASEPTLTIASIGLEGLQSPDENTTRDRLIVRFKESQRGWVLNKTNAILMAAMFKSDDTDKWLGRRVTLCSTSVQFGKEQVLGIRVKGSPELAAPLAVELKMPRKKATRVVLVPTAKQDGARRDH